MAIPDFSNMDFSGIGAFSGLGAQLGAPVPGLSGPGALGSQLGQLGETARLPDITGQMAGAFSGVNEQFSDPGLGMDEAWEQERRRLKGIASGAMEDPSVTAMRKQQALAGAQAYGAVPQMQSAAARSRLQGGARGAVELEAGQALRAQQLQSQQAAKQNLAQQLAQAQATEQKRLEEERRAALAAELTRNQAAYREQAADQQRAMLIAQTLGTSALGAAPKP